jgi:serine/threonine protein phosphatase 1
MRSDANYNSIVLKKFYNRVVPLEIPDGMKRKNILKLEPNARGTDFVCGDIHSQWDKLKNQLESINFDKERDRLFCVGDLIDRGSDGFRVLDFIKKDWFFSVMGNHEDLILSILSLPESYVETLIRLGLMNGSEWLLFDEKIKNILHSYTTNNPGINFEQLMSDFPKIREIYYEFSQLPFVIEIGDVGIIHAEVPLEMKSWDELLDSVEKQDIDTLESLTWERQRITKNVNEKIEGIRKIFCGHSIVEEVKEMENHIFIDTGAYAKPNNPLTILKI